MVSAGDQRMVFRAGLTAAPSSSTAHAAPQLRLQPANDGHDSRAIQHYLGHRSTALIVRYTALTPDRFKEFWKD
jgi:hypothetical protein